MPENPPIHPGDNELYLPDEPETSSSIVTQPQKAKRWEEWKRIFHENFDFRTDKEKDSDIIASIRQDIDFKGTKLWILVCAILVASLGLNVNSTAVIIGAMCISPLMGPIVGFGTALVIDNYELLKKSLRNLIVMTLISIITATLYFLISPISTKGSELLARTSPTIYDVLIALFGGAAGMIANCTKSKGQVLPGVAIATALMPPLCTVGFGLATGDWSCMLGAFYLFLINGVFIAFATYLIGRILKLPKKTFVDPKRGAKVRRIIFIITVCTVLPSIYFGFLLVQESIRERHIENYVKEAFRFPETNLVRHEFETVNKVPTLKVMLIGTPLTQRTIDSLNVLKSQYDLQDVNLVIQQGLSDKEEVNIGALKGELKTDVLRDLYNNSTAIIEKQNKEIDSLKNMLQLIEYHRNIQQEIKKEAQVLFPNIHEIQFTANDYLNNQKDSTIQVVMTPKKAQRFRKEELKKLGDWIATRTGHKHAYIILNNNTEPQK